MDGKDSESLGDEGHAAKVTPSSEDIKKTDEQDAETLKDNNAESLLGKDQKSSEDESKVKVRTRIISSSLSSNSFSLLQKRKRKDKEEAESSEDESKVKVRTRIISSSLSSNSFSLLQKRKTSTNVDGRKNKPLKWPIPVYEAIIQLKAEDPSRPINADFLKSVNNIFVSGITTHAINSWWGRHQRESRERSSGTSASPSVKKEEKKVKLTKKKSLLDSDDDDEDYTEDGEDSKKSTPRTVKLKHIPAILAAASDATVRLKSTSRTHTLTS